MNMNRSVRRVLAYAAFGGMALVSQPGAANVTYTVDFESVPPNLYFDTESFDQGPYRLTVGGDFGVVDTAAAFFVAQAPTGNPTQFYAGLNDSHLSMARIDGGIFSLLGFDAGFVTPAPVGAGVDPGFILALATDSGGSLISYSWAFTPSDAAGAFAFASYGGAAGFSLFTDITSVDFYACTFTASGSCENVNENLSQFAIDNIVAVVPEPSSVALLALGLMGLAVRRRRGR